MSNFRSSNRTLSQTLLGVSRYSLIAAIAVGTLSALACDETGPSPVGVHEAGIVTPPATPPAAVSDAAVTSDAAVAPTDGGAVTDAKAEGGPVAAGDSGTDASSDAGSDAAQ